MCGYGAEAAAAETAPVYVHGELYHFPCGDGPLLIISGVRGITERQLIETVHLLFGSRRKGWIDHRLPVAARFCQPDGPGTVAGLLEEDEVFGISFT